MPDQLEDELVAERSQPTQGMRQDIDALYLPPQYSKLLQNHDLRTIGLRQKRQGSNSYGDFTGVTTPIGTNCSVMLAVYDPTNAQTISLVTVGAAAGVQHLFALDVKVSTTDVGINRFLVADQIRVYLMRPTANVLSIAIAGILSGGGSYTDEGDTNTKFPRSLQAIWTSQNRMLAISDLTTGAYSPDLVWYSNSLDAQTWDRTNNAKRVSGSRYPFNTGLIEWQENLIIVSKTDALMLLDISNPQPGNWSGKKLVEGVGIPYTGGYQGRRMVRYGNDVVILSHEGLFLLSQLLNGNFVPFSREVKDEIDDFLAYNGSASPVASVGNVHLEVYDHQLYVVRRDISYTLRYDFLNRRWSKDDKSIYSLVGIPATVIGSRTLYAVGTNGAAGAIELLRLATGTTEANSEAIEYQEESGGLWFQHPQNLKNAEGFSLQYLANASGGSLVVEYQLDESQSWTTLATINLTKKADQVTAATADELVTYQTNLNALAPFYVMRLRLTESTIYACRIVYWEVQARVNNFQWGG